MNDLLFKLSDPIREGSLAEFEAEHNFKPTRAADLTEFGWAWGSIDPAPSIAAGQTVQRGTPVLEGAFVRVPRTARDKTPEELLAELPYDDKESAKARVLEWADDFLAPLEDGYSNKEIQSWPVKGPAAINYLDGAASPAELIILQAEVDALQVASPGVTLAQVATLIKSKAEPYLAALAFTSALRQIVNAQIDATTELAEIPPIFDAAIAAATAKAVALGLPGAGA